MISNCKHLSDLLKVQQQVIQRNLEVHKWLQHIPDSTQATIDFIDSYAWVLREVYCGYTCPDRIDCAIAKAFLPKEIKLYDATNDEDVLLYFEDKEITL